MTDEQKTNHAFARSLSNVWLGANEHRKAMIEFERMSESLLRERGKIISAIKIGYVLKPDAPTEIVEMPTPAQIELLKQIEDMLEYMRKICFAPNVK